MPEVHNTVVLGTARVFTGVLLGQACYQNTLRRADHLATDVHHILVQPVLENAQALFLHLQ